MKTETVTLGACFISPRFLSSFAAWLKSRWSYAIEEARYRVSEGFIPTLGAFMLDRYWKKSDEAVLTLWAEKPELARPLLEAVSSLAIEEGFARIHLYVDEALFNDHFKRLGVEVKETHIVLYEELRPNS